MISFDKLLLEERVESAVRRIYTGQGLFGCIESIKMEFDDCEDDDFYGTMIIRYGRYDTSNREDLNFNKTVELHIGPEDLSNYDFFEGMVYMAININDDLD